MLESLIFSLNSTMPLFFLMLLGYLLHRRQFLTDDFVAMANKFVFHVALPVQLFRDLATMDVRASFDGPYVLFCAAATTASILVIWGLARLFLKDKHIVGEFVQASYRSSAAILGAAFIQNIYGTSGLSGLMILGSVPLYNIFAVVVLTLESPSQDARSGMGEKLVKSLKGIVTNPILLGIAAGFVWSLLRLPMPAMANKTLSSLAGMTSPLALLAIGAGFKGRAALGYLQAHGRCNGHQAHPPAGHLPARGGAAGLCGPEARGADGHAGQCDHPGGLRHGQTDGPRRHPDRQCLRHHHLLQRPDPDLLGLLGEEPRLHRINKKRAAAKLLPASHPRCHLPLRGRLYSLPLR